MAEAVVTTDGVMPVERPSLWQLSALFFRIGLTSFGGGLSGWLLRELVRSKRWMGEAEFLDMLAICQALPGINIANLAIWIGYRFAGGWGSVACFTALIVPPGVVMILLSIGLASLAQFPLTHLAMTGAAAGAIGLAFTMGITVAIRVRRALVPLAVLAGTFITVGLLHWSLIWVALVGSVLSVGVEYVRLGRN